MQPDTWSRVEDLFERAADLDPPDRSAFLDRACGRDEKLRQLVEALFDADDRAGEFIARAIEKTAGSSPRESTPVAGQRVGSYVVIRELGRGGMGKVFLAERDGEFHQRVAIKLIRGLFSQELLRRFELERRILARLEHPSIARLLDGGATEGGTPYVVMEFVDGERIDDYCGHNELDWTERLNLFRQVCDAVQFAHRNLIVHRDLKPANVLVTAEGVPKLLDFGIAKLLGSDSTDTAGPTASTLRLLTPDYASPEQIRGEPISTSSDVYSLGVLLYELLTGVHPYKTKTDRVDELLRAICEQEPEQPSVAVLRSISEDNATSLRRCRFLSGDLDNILAMALRKEPGRRYASVADLSEDLARHLAGHPVAARPDTWRYRTSKFVLRHRIGVGAVAAFVVLVGAFGFAMSGQLAETRRERARAERVSEFLVDVFRTSDPERAVGEVVTARQILDTAAARVRSEFDEDPRVRASMLHIIGVVYANLGLHDRAVPLIDDALELRVTALGEEHPETLESRAEQATLRFRTGRIDEAETLIRDVLDTRKRVLGERHPDTLRSMYDLAWFYRAGSRRDRATVLWNETLDLQRDVLGEKHPETLRTLLASTSWMYTDAGPIVREVLEAQRRILGERHPDTLTTTRMLADHYLWFPETRTDAELLYRRCIDTQTEVLGVDHPDTLVSRNGLIMLLLFDERWEEAEMLAAETRDLWLRIAGAEHPRTLRGELYLANAWRGQGRLTEAEGTYRRASLVARRVLSEDDPLNISLDRELARVLSMKGHYDEADRLGLRVLAAWKRVVGEEGHEVTVSLADLACLATERGDKPKAFEYIREVVQRGDGGVGGVSRSRCLEELRDEPGFPPLFAEADRLTRLLPRPMPGHD